MDLRESKRQSKEWKYTNLPVKKKLLAQQWVNKVVLTVLRDVKGAMINGFCEIANSSFYS